MTFIMNDKLKTIKSAFQTALNKANSMHDLESIDRAFLGRKGKVRAVFKQLQGLSPKARKEAGQQINQLKQELHKLLLIRRGEIKSEQAPSAVQVDVTLPAKKVRLGKLHPITQLLDECEKIFSSLGFQLVEGPEIENEYYNFDALNIPPQHPARDLWDTYWIKAKKRVFQTAHSPREVSWIKDEARKDRLLLRTHTSPMQVRYLERAQPPLRIIVPGRCFRFERSDASHNIQFYQIEGLYVDRDVSVGNFKGVISLFFAKLFGRKAIKLRMLPDYFPFTEPSFQVAVECVFCEQRGCSSCKQSGWIELMGAGMVHPAVFKAAGYVPGEWQGFAFGLGLDRLAMVKYKIDDIRLLYCGDLRVLQQF